MVGGVVDGAQGFTYFFCLLVYSPQVSVN